MSIQRSGLSSVYFYIDPSNPRLINSSIILFHILQDNNSIKNLCHDGLLTVTTKRGVMQGRNRENTRNQVQEDGR